MPSPQAAACCARDPHRSPHRRRGRAHPPRRRVQPGPLHRAPPPLRALVRLPPLRRHRQRRLPHPNGRRRASRLGRVRLQRRRGLPPMELAGAVRPRALQQQQHRLALPRRRLLLHRHPVRQPLLTLPPVTPLLPRPSPLQWTPLLDSKTDAAACLAATGSSPGSRIAARGAPLGRAGLIWERRGGGVLWRGWGEGEGKGGI